MNRRGFMKMAAAGASTLAFGAFFRTGKALAAEAVDKLSRSDAEWKKILPPQQYDILRQEGTERPFTSPLLNEHREGVFACAACELPLFPSAFKFDSGTGWPSFYDVLPGHVETKSDRSLLMTRTEYHCARCGGHHGHLFDDGPKPTGLRYCSNGAVLIFIPKQGA